MMMLYGLKIKIPSEEWAYWAHKLKNGTALPCIAGEATKCRYPVKGRKAGAPLPACGVHPGGIPPPVTSPRAEKTGRTRKTRRERTRRTS